MNIWRVIAATLVIFLAGVITGAIATNHFHVRQPQAAAASAPTASLPEHALWPRTSTNVPPASTNAWRRLTTDFMASFGKELNLTLEQAAKIETIITDGQKRTKELSDQLQPKIRDEMKETRESIRAQLNPEQREKFDTLYRGKPAAKKPETPKKKPVKKTSKGNGNPIEGE